MPIDSTPHTIKRKPFLLLVDDDEDQLFLFQTLLERHGCNVLVANSAAAATDILNQVHVDIVVTDVNMPETNGFELIENLRKASDLEQLPIITISADSTLDPSLAKNSGADAYFNKADAKSFLEEIAKLCNSTQNGKPLLKQIKQRFSLH